MSAILASKYQYLWPARELKQLPQWQLTEDKRYYVRNMPESPEEFATDTQWPGFFPSPICFVTTSDGQSVALEKVVGPSIVNRFPYVVSLSFCIEELSKRHHVRSTFIDMLEKGESVAVQFLPPGPVLDSAMQAIVEGDEADTTQRIAKTGLKTRKARSNDAPVFDQAYLVYEAKLVKPGKDFLGNPINETSWVDQGSHRIYFLEITAIQLREDIARGKTQIHWQSLPDWTPINELQMAIDEQEEIADFGRYQKGYTPKYVFPTEGTIAFEADEFVDGMAIKFLPPLAPNEVEIDNDRTRWPCFFPSSAGMITSWASDGFPNLMPCGSTSVVSRHPFIIAPCVCYTGPNDRYCRRATLDHIRESGRFGCGVPFIDETVVQAIRYAGNISLNTDPNKINRAGLQYDANECAPQLQAMPIHYECKVIGEIALGTHIMFLGEVRKIFVRADLGPTNPIKWTPWAYLEST